MQRHGNLNKSTTVAEARKIVNEGSWISWTTKSSMDPKVGVFPTEKLTVFFVESILGSQKIL